jgi:hypothetical protein
MHVGDTLLWGLLATGLLTTLLRAGQALHLTRMDTTLLLGTMVTPDRDRAKVAGGADGCRAYGVYSRRSPPLAARRASANGLR